MAIKTQYYNTNKTDNNVPNLKHFLIFLRDNGLRFKTNDYYGRGYVLDDIEMNEDEIIEKFKEEDYE